MEGEEENMRDLSLPAQKNPRFGDEVPKCLMVVLWRKPPQ